MLKYRDDRRAWRDRAGAARLREAHARRSKRCLHDHARCGLVLVSLDEPLVRAETERLAAAVRERGIDVGAVDLESRRTISPSLFQQRLPRAKFSLSEVQPPPIGARALRAVVAHPGEPRYEFLTVVHGFIDVECTVVRVRHRAGELLASRRCRPGIDDAEVRLERGDEVAALVSVLDGALVRTTRARDEQRRRGVAEPPRRRARSRAHLGERSGAGRPAADVLAVQRHRGCAGHAARSRGGVGADAPTTRQGPRVRAPRLPCGPRADGEHDVTEPASRRPRGGSRSRRRPDSAICSSESSKRKRRTRCATCTQRIVDDMVRALGAHAIQSKRVAIPRAGTTPQHREAS